MQHYQRSVSQFQSSLPRGSDDTLGGIYSILSQISILAPSRERP